MSGALSDRGGGDRPDRARPGAAAPGRSPASPPEPPSASANDARSVATSPAVGYFLPRADLTLGSRVRAGDLLGAVDMLGVAA